MHSTPIGTHQPQLALQQCCPLPQMLPPHAPPDASASSATGAAHVAGPEPGEADAADTDGPRAANTNTTIRPTRHSEMSFMVPPPRSVLEHASVSCERHSANCAITSVNGACCGGGRRWSNHSP